MTNAYLEALRRIPRGQTRSFMELAAMAGRPGAARAAGRAIASCRGSAKFPWHRVVSSDGGSRDPLLRTRQLARLRREGARPRAREAIAAWAERVGAHFVGLYGTRELAPRTDDRTLRWNRERVEPFTSEASARARGFCPIGGAGRDGPPLPRERVVTTGPELTLPERCRNVDWSVVRRELEEVGVHRLEALLAPSECARLLNESTEIERFERTIQMLPRGYGVGTYHYYREPLPEPAGALRELLYDALAPQEYPATLSDFWERCRRAGQRRASSILIAYGMGGINHPHRDVYGKELFPFQALIALSKRGRDFTGGDFYVADEDGGREPKKIAVDEGDVVLFATRDRYDNGRKIPVRHGMTMVTSGTRYGLGLVFHLAE